LILYHVIGEVLKHCILTFVLLITENPFKHCILFNMPHCIVLPRYDPFELEAPQSNQLSSFGTSGSNLMLTSPCALTWLQQSVHASLLYDRSVAYDIFCRVQPCWP